MIGFGRRGADKPGTDKNTGADKKAGGEKKGGADKSEDGRFRGPLGRRRAGSTRVGRGGTRPAAGAKGARGGVRPVSVLRRRRPSRGLVLGVLAAVLVLAGVLTWLIGFSSVLAVKNVAVTGAAQVSEETVRETAQAPLGQPLARVDYQAVADRVAALPEVDRVDVKPKYPTTLRIDVLERVPAYALDLQGSWLVVDRGGYGYQTVPARPDDMLPATAPANDPRMLADVATVAGSLPPPLREATTRVDAPGRDSIKLVLSGDREIFFGSADQAQLKGEVAAALLGNTKASVIDVSSPGHPATR